MEARKRRAEVHILLGARQAFGNATRVMRGMATCFAASGIEVRCRSGEPLSLIYSRTTGGDGIYYCKTLR
eukprot:11612254-Alexandrium_andersonii.AAC.1